MKPLNRFTEDNVERALKALNAMYGITLDFSDKNIGMLQEKALSPKNVTPPDYFWIEACNAKKVPSVLGDKASQEAESAFNLNLNALIALYSMNFIHDITPAGDSQKEDKSLIRVSKEELINLWDLDTQADSLVWMFEQAGIAKDAMRNDEDFYYLTVAQMDKIKRFMKGEDKKQLISDKVNLPHDTYVVENYEAYSRYKEILPIATDIMSDRLKNIEKSLAEFFPHLAMHLQILDETAIEQGWVHSSDEVEAKKTKIYDAFLAKINQCCLEVEANGVYNENTLRLIQQKSQKKLKFLQKEYTETVNACIQVSNVSFNAIEIKETQKDSGQVVKSPALMVNIEALRDEMCDKENKLNTVNAIVKYIGIDKEFVHALPDHSVSDRKGKSNATYVVITGQENIARIKQLGASIVRAENPVMLVDPWRKKYDDVNAFFTSINGRQSTPDNLISLEDIRQKKLNNTHEHKR